VRLRLKPFLVKPPLRLFLLLLVTAIWSGEPSAQAQVSANPYIVEWVYKVKLGHEDEFWQIFRKYQIATERRKEAGQRSQVRSVSPGPSHKR
jgi:hypothetical protein